jgi:beta-lactamase regulating signal transducer with metallopeptidase domain
MNLPIFLASSPAGAVLLKWTALLALAWVAHGLLRKAHARWRLILWRGMLCFGLVLPLVPLLPRPDFSVAIPIVRAPELDSADSLVPRAGGQVIQEHSSSTQSAAERIETTQSPIKLGSSLSSVSPERASRGRSLSIIWVLGGIWCALRLIRLQIKLSRLRNAAGPAGPTLRKLAREIQAEWGVKRTIEIRVSDSIVSPFICGPLKPMIMLPETLARNLSSVELSALLAHEIAHFRQRDLIWCVAWQWMKAICWFHPLIWNVPAAHNLACEEEADRIACAQFRDRGSYAQWLAQLALRVLALPAVETGLALNGTAQIVQRLNHLRRERLGAWKRWYSVVGVVVIGLLFLLMYGFTDEPVYHFKSVTQWLDSMALFDEVRNMDENGNHSYRLPQSPEVVTNDPALRALLAMGSKAVPTLEKRLNEAPLPPARDPLSSLESWAAWKWRHLLGDNVGPPAAQPLYFGNFQHARMAAAGLAMLALGTNNHAGALRLIEIAADKRSKGQQYFTTREPFAIAKAGLPERRQEIIDGIVAGLNSTNAQIQFMACAATGSFYSNLPAWKNKLMELAQGPVVDVSLPGGPEADVGQWALWSLATADPKDEEIMALCEKSVQDKSKPPGLRAKAAAALGMAGDTAALPLLRAVLTEQGVSKDGSPTFSVDDLKDLPGLINRWIGHSDPASAFLWENLSESDQSLLKSYQPSSRSSKQAQDIVLQVLQKTVGGPSIYKVERFKGISLRPETIGLTYDRPTGFKLAHFNRLLLEDAYPQELLRSPSNRSALQRNVREAIDRIEKSLAGRKATAESAANAK